MWAAEADVSPTCHYGDDSKSGAFLGSGGWAYSRRVCTVDAEHLKSCCSSNVRRTPRLTRSRSRETKGPRVGEGLCLSSRQRSSRENAKEPPLAATSGILPGRAAPSALVGSLHDLYRLLREGATVKFLDC